jgi:hypothetical protein
VTPLLGTLTVPFTTNHNRIYVKDQGINKLAYIGTSNEMLFITAPTTGSDKILQFSSAGSFAWVETSSLVPSGVAIAKTVAYSGTDSGDINLTALGFAAGAIVVAELYDSSGNEVEADIERETNDNTLNVMTSESLTSHNIVIVGASA